MADTDSRTSESIEDPAAITAAIEHYLNSSTYLLDKGWLPSPSTAHLSAWEHPSLSVDPGIKPELFAYLYEPGRFRTRIEDALTIQKIVDKRIQPNPNRRYPIIVFWTRR